MGLFDSDPTTQAAAPEPLQAYPTPLGVFETYCLHTHQVILKLREKRLSLSGDSFEITTADGKPLFKAKPEIMSLYRKNILLDASGTHPVLNIQQKPLSLHREFRIFPGDTDVDPLVTVRGKFKIISTPEMTVTFKNRADGAEVLLDVVGDFWERKASITHNGQVVARVDRTFVNSGQLLFGQGTYYLTVAPGVDTALMAAVCICLDEKAEAGK